MAEGALRPRWGQPLTGIISTIVFFLVAVATWYLFSDPRGPVGSFPYPFVLYLAMMILVGLWQHMLFGDWPFENVGQPWRGIIQTVMNLVLVWFVIHVVFYRILGLGFNFLSQSNLESLAAAGKTAMPDNVARTLALEALVKPAARFGERAVVCFVLIGFYSYPFVTILFGKWPVRPSDLKQPQAGMAELGWASFLTLFFYIILIVPFWGMIYGELFGKSFAMGLPWWEGISGIKHVHWVFGWWEWMVIILFMTANVWRGKPWSAISLPQPWKGLISFVINVALAYVLAVACVWIAPMWLPADTMEKLAEMKKLVAPAAIRAEWLRFLWYHAAEIAGFTLIPFLAWHHYFDDGVPMAEKDSWGAFLFRTVGVLLLAALTYYAFYYLNFGHWGLGNHEMVHLAERFPNGESLVWNFWWIIPLLWNEWFFHKWPFYTHEGGH
jgi:AAT family amino acid transporter